MNEWFWSQGPVFISGLLIGSFYFGGLWFSVRYLLYFRHAGLWFLISFILRNLIALFGLYLTMNGQWQRLAVTLVGFFFIRFILLKQVQKKVRPTSVCQTGR